MSPLPLLLTGISGVAGYNAFYYFRAKYPGRVIGLRQRNNWRLTGDGIEICDAEDRDRLARLFDEHRFAAVLDCAGNCALKSCELDSDMAWRINVEGVRNLLDVIGGRARFVHLSVDLVYSGTPHRDPAWPGYREGDPTDPVTVYGKTMVAAEALILDRDPCACILRISLPMGISFNGHAGAIDWIQSRFKHGRPATLYYDEVRSPTYTDCLSPTHADQPATPMTRNSQQNAYRLAEIARISGMANDQDKPAVRWWNRPVCPFWVVLVAFGALVSLVLLDPIPLDPMPEKQAGMSPSCASSRPAGQSAPLGTESEPTTEDQSRDHRLRRKARPLLSREIRSGFRRDPPSGPPR